MNQYVILDEKKQIAISYDIHHLGQIIKRGSTYNIGDIYLGNVISILDNLNIAFVKLDTWKQNGFMVLKNESTFSLEKKISLGEEISVQITKQQTSRKGPTVTKNINIESEYLKGYLHENKFFLFEREYKISERKYLRTINKLIKPIDTSINIKKNASEINIWNIISDFKEVKSRLLALKQKIKTTKEKPCLISKKQTIIDLVLKKGLIEEKTIIIVKSKKEALKTRKEFSLITNNKKKFYIEYANKTISDKYEYYIEYLIEKGLKTNVKLNNGGYIIIEKTEALTSIDVNSGSFSKLKSSRETILWINLAATKEIINQLKIRNISGIIIIDFIGMINQDDQLSLLEYLDKQLQSNLSGSKIIQISEIGLVEIIRQREERNIYDMFTEECTECKGIGYLRKKNINNKISTYFSELSSIYR